MSEMNISLRKWVKKYIKEKFNDDIERKLNDERREGIKEKKELEENETKIILQLVVNEMVKTREINEIIIALKRMKNSTDNDDDEDENIQINMNLLDNIEENLQSYKSDDLTSENWCPELRSQMEGNNLSMIFDEISMDKPVHVRLGGFEALFESDLSNNCNSDTFENLLKLLKDGIADMTKSVFEASLRVHSKLLDSPRSHDVYTNLLNAFEAEYHSVKCHESLPNFATGINFKIFYHEKLLRILHVIVKYHKEILKITRNIDRIMEEMIDQFVILLTYDENKKNTHCKNLSALNLLSLLEPHADWSAKWMYSVGTRKTFITAVSKSPSLLHTICNIVQKGLEQPVFNGALAYSMRDDVTQSMYRSVYISGDTIETITYLHCLNIVSQMNNCCFNGLSSDISLGYNADLPLSLVDFLLALIKSLNLLATTTTPKTIYSTSQHALKLMINQPTRSFDANIGHLALIPLGNFIAENNGNLWPHTIDLMNFMLDSNDGLIFFTSPYECSPTGNSSPIPLATPASSLLNYTSNILRQPIAVMNVDHVVQILQLVGKLFHIIENFDIIYEILESQLYPALEYFYNKIQKYSIRQENMSQLLDSAIKDMLLKIVDWPLGLQLLPEYPMTFEELIRGSINPFRHSWSSNEIISFLSSVTYFDGGCKLMVDLVPHTISMLLDEINNNMENEEHSIDVQNCQHIKKFTHVLSLFSLNTKCFLIFMMEEDSTDDNSSDPRNLTQLFKNTMIIDSSFHYLSLLALETVIWNLDILIYLLNCYNLQSKFLQLQDCCLMKVTKHKDDSQNEDNEEFTHSNDYVEESKIEEMHEVHLVDETSMLRNRILSKSYFIRHKLDKLMNDQSPEKCILYSTFPPPTSENDGSMLLLTTKSSLSELDELLQDCNTGFRDSGWVMQVRNAYGSLRGSLKHSTYINLLNQMERATAAVEWIDMFKWNNSKSTPIVYEWLPEEIIGLDLVIRFAEDHWENSNNKLNVKDNLKQIFESIHTFINYQKKAEYFEGFDWFLGTVFIICDGNLDRCKNFVKNLVRFPSAIYMWHMHGISYDTSSDQTCTTQFILAQQIHSIVSQEFPAINHAMMNECGMKWWMICNRLLSQCFWGVLEWSEIIHFLSICILYPPDHIVYYCVSLLQHCEAKIMQDIINKKYWPENIDLSSYQCHNYIAYMDRLAKKYQNHILPSLNQSKSTTSLHVE